MTTALPAVAVSGVGVGMSPEERAAGLWYVERLKLDELHAQGATGAGVKIAVVDAGLNPDAAELAGANITVKGAYCAYPETGEPVPAVSDDPERAAHGTDVVAMLVGNGVAADGGPGTRGIVPEAEVWFYATGVADEQGASDRAGCEKYNASAGEFYDESTLTGAPGYFLGGVGGYAAQRAVEDGADIVVHSGISADIAGWSIAMISALRAGVPLVAGTPNPDGSLDSVLALNYPYSLNGAVAVSAIDSDAKILNGGGGLRDPYWGNARGSRNLAFVSAGSAILTPSGGGAWGPAISYGTSLATPLVAGVIAMGLQKYPSATANQVLQAMIRTTGSAGLHEPKWLREEFGYGVANPSSLLAVDPAVYPDENPFVIMDVSDPRCFTREDQAEPRPTTMLGCDWAIGPDASEVWPDESLEGESEAAVPALAIVLGIGLAAAVVVVVAVWVPLLIARSRKRRIPIHQLEPQHWR
ncbi:S8 family serine peptidase [Leucobacter albus]|uniref:S8 family serine peptidase n=1 Tax=Leucobacter albus TaxID=272210 RepID=UPI0031DC590F